MMSREKVISLYRQAQEELRSAEQRDVTSQIQYYSGMIKAYRIVLFDIAEPGEFDCIKVLENADALGKLQWLDPVYEINQNKQIIRQFTAEESREIDQRLDDSMGVNTPKLINLKGAEE